MPDLSHDSSESLIRAMPMERENNDSISPRGTVLQAGQNYHVMGGSDRYLIELAALVQKLGYRAIPFAAQDERNLTTPWGEFFPRRINFASPRLRDIVGYMYSADAARMLTALLKRERVDIAHLHIYYGQLTGAILPVLKKFDVPIVQTLHEYKTVCPTYTLTANEKICERCSGLSYYKALATRCNRGSVFRTMLSVAEAYATRALGGIAAVDRFIAVSHFQKKKLVEMGLRDEKIEVVHNFVDCSAINPTYEVGEYFLFFGRLERVKGIYTLLRAAGKLNGAPIRIVGDGSERDRIRRFIQEKRLRNVSVIDFLPTKKLQGLIAGCLCTVVPSEWYETFGLTALESFAQGKPVIASAIGGLTEVVEDGTTGFLFPPGDVDALCERMQWMVENESRVRRMGVEARKVAVNKFGPDAHGAKIKRIYESYISPTPDA